MHHAELAGAPQSMACSAHAIRQHPKLPRGPDAPTFWSAHSRYVYRVWCTSWCTECVVVWCHSSVPPLCAIRRQSSKLCFKTYEDTRSGIYCIVYRAWCTSWCTEHGAHRALAVLAVLFAGHACWASLFSMHARAVQPSCVGGSM